MSLTDLAAYRHRMGGMSASAKRVALLSACAFMVTPAIALAQRVAAPKLARTPYVGVACRQPANSCGRIGVAVWLAGPATRIDAALLGRNVRLSTSHAGTGAYGYRRYWTGFIHLPPAQVKSGTYDVRVRITVTGDGTTAHFTRLVYLSAGWG